MRVSAADGARGLVAREVTAWPTGVQGIVREQPSDAEVALAG